MAPEFWHKLFQATALFVGGGAFVFLDRKALLSGRVGLGVFAGFTMIATSIVRYFRLFGWA